MRFILFPKTAIVLLAAAHIGAAGTIFSNFSPVDSFDTGGIPWTIGAGVLQEVAASFTPTTTDTVGTVRIPVAHTLNTNTYHVMLTEDNAGVPGTILEQWDTSFPTSVAILNLASLIHPTLTAGVTYWLHLAVDWDGLSLTGNGAWYRNDQVLLGMLVRSSITTPPAPDWMPFSGVTPAFEITSDTPEPAGSAMILLALAALLLRYLLFSGASGWLTTAFSTGGTVRK